MQISPQVPPKTPEISAEAKKGSEKAKSFVVPEGVPQNKLHEMAAAIEAAAQDGNRALPSKAEFEQLGNEILDSIPVAAKRDSLIKKLFDLNNRALTLDFCRKENITNYTPLANPKKILERYPDHVLSDEEVELVKEQYLEAGYAEEQSQEKANLQKDQVNNSFEIGQGYRNIIEKADILPVHPDGHCCYNSFICSLLQTFEKDPANWKRVVANLDKKIHDGKTSTFLRAQLVNLKARFQDVVLEMQGGVPLAQVMSNNEKRAALVHALREVVSFRLDQEPANIVREGMAEGMEELLRQEDQHLEELYQDFQTKERNLQEGSKLQPPIGEKEVEEAREAYESALKEKYLWEEANMRRQYPIWGSDIELNILGKELGVKVGIWSCAAGGEKGIEEGDAASTLKIDVMHSYGHYQSIVMK
jgi:hypothetical protein